jgi:hypothetical protein
MTQKMVIATDAAPASVIATSAKLWVEHAHGRCENTAKKINVRDVAAARRIQIARAMKNNA